MTTTQRDETKRRRIMHDFKLTELSAVDRPAQEGARAVLMKRADDEQEQEQDMMSFQKIGGDDVAAFDSFEAAVQHLKSVHGMTPLAAMEAAADRHPDLLKRYNQQGTELAKAAAVSRIRTVPREVRRFDDLVEQVQARDRIPRLAALEQARREFPREFEAYQAAASTRDPADLRPPGAVAV